MIYAARIQSVIELLDEVMTTPRPADALASHYFRNRRYIGSKDRTAISDHFYGLMRRYLRLQWWVKNCGGAVTARNMVAADLTLTTQDNVNEVFSGARFCPALLDDDERFLLKRLKGHSLETSDMPVPVQVECPEWAEAPLQQALGDGFVAEMRAMLSQAPLDLRVNIIKASRDDLLQRLREEGFEAEAGLISPLSIRMRTRQKVINHGLFQEGYFEIQDEGSQMVALLADAKPGEQVVDFCAGAGGKTLAIAASMNNKGRVIAMDVSAGKLESAKERFRRAGLHNIETRVLTSERDKYVKKHAGYFDLVLVDAPCSGVGTWRRDPDKRWRQLGPGLDVLVPLQKNILESAARMVKKGGRLIYATCSLLPEENTEQIKTFLSTHTDFKIKPAVDVLGQSFEHVQDKDGFLHMTPARHDTDGFFAACLIKQGGTDG